MSIAKNLAAAALLALLMLSPGCAKKKAEPEGYRVVSYDAATHQWTILRTGTFDGKYLRKRLTVLCSWFQWGDHESVDGPEACDLQVGRMMIPNPFPSLGKRKEFLDIWELSADWLFITEGDGPDRVRQAFAILKYEVLPDDDKR